MPSYKVELSRPAAKYLQKLDQPTQKRITAALFRLAKNPDSTHFDIKPLSGRPGELRLRVGDYRIIYMIKNEIVTIYVITIRPRGDVYK